MENTDNKTLCLDNITVIESKKGGYTLRVTCEDGSHKTLHSLYDPEAEARTLVNSFEFDGRGILVVLGLGLGYHVKELSRKYTQAEIVVLECLPSCCHRLGMVC